MEDYASFAQRQKLIVNYKREVALIQTTEIEAGKDLAKRQEGVALEEGKMVAKVERPFAIVLHPLPLTGVFRRG